MRNYEGTFRCFAGKSWSCTFEGEGEDDYDYDPKMEKVTTVLAIVAGIVICIILIVLAVS